MAEPPGILARGPWAPDRVRARWSAEEYEPEPDVTAAADAAVAALSERGSPSHDGLAARLAGWEASDAGLALELQPARWSLRLVDDAADDSLSTLCVARAADGRWLAGRRAPWVASWAGRWALGAGGSVEVGEDPVQTLSRELDEEWSLAPERMSVEALVRLPRGLNLLVGMAGLPAGAEPVPDEEHDEWAWWPAEVAAWPDEAHDPLRRMAQLLS
jgi:ADP-ribose pyrophosphatase YjhB (NUDIX family)